MILLDTHIWIWLADGREDRLTQEQREAVQRELESGEEDSGLGLSIFSCWEVAKKVEIGKLEVADPVETWIRTALERPRLRLIDVTLDIALASTQLPTGLLTKDPTDQLIIATARVLDLALVTQDQKIRDYPHVRTI